MISQLIRRRQSSEMYCRFLPVTISSGNDFNQSKTKNLLNYNYQHYLSSSPVLFKDASTFEKLKREMKFEKVKQELLRLKTVDLKELKSAPFPAVLYGFGGAIPFIFPPIYFLLGSFSPFLATSQLIYGATILAFVGGVKWGSAVAREDISHEQIGLSTIPSLVAWSALLLPEPIGYLIVSTGLLGALYMDLVSSKYPPWFFAIRLSLTSIAVTSLMVSFFCQLLH